MRRTSGHDPGGMSVYERLVGLLDSRGAEYRLVHHEGTCTLTDPAQAIKCVAV